MKCPKCNVADTKVVDSRHNKDGDVTRRRRLCEACQHRFTTFEKIEYSLPLIRKKSGEAEAFDAEKMLTGVKRACEKRPLSQEDFDQMVQNIEQKLISIESKEISARELGQLVLAELKKMDSVAYVRFASVYEEFKTVEEFLKVIQELPNAN